MNRQRLLKVLSVNDLLIFGHIFNDNNSIFSLAHKSEMDKYMESQMDYIVNPELTKWLTIDLIETLLLGLVLDITWFDKGKFEVTKIDLNAPV